MARSVNPKRPKSVGLVKEESESSDQRSLKFRGKDFHPEMMGSWSAKRLEVLKMRKKQRKLKRTAMGEYIPSPNRSPLALAAVPTPSAFDYHPNIDKTLTASPKYTIAKKFRVWKKAPSPGPAEYGKLEDFYTECKAHTMKARPFWFTHLAREKKYQKVGPASYMLSSTLRANGVVVSSRPPYETNVGMLPSYPYPPAGSQNTAGFYGTQPSLEKGIKFGIIPKALTKDEFPGPIYEVPPKFPEGLKFQLHGRLPWPPKIEGWDAPAPKYNPQSELGKGGKFPRVTNRLPSVIQGNKVGPGPNRYAAFKPKLGVPKTMGQYPLPSRFPRQPMPAPNQYTIEPLFLPKEEKPKLKPKFLKMSEPAARVRGPKIIGRQETMITLRHSAVENPPPASIHLSYFKEEKFGVGAPGARILSRPIEKADIKIAPNKYHPCSNPRLKRIPAYTFGHKISDKREALTINVEPRPLPSTMEVKTQFTFGVPLSKPVSDIPSPSRYSVPSTFECLKSKPCRGASLKGRRTPFALPGIAKIKTPVTPTRVQDRSRSSPEKK